MFYAIEVYAILKEKDISVDSTTWNRRYREYMEKIKTGSVFEIAEVLRDLYLLKGDKDLSFGERKMLDTARSLLIKELGIDPHCSRSDIVGKPAAMMLLNASAIGRNTASMISAPGWSLNPSWSRSSLGASSATHSSSSRTARASIDDGARVPPRTWRITGHTSER